MLWLSILRKFSVTRSAVLILGYIELLEMWKQLALRERKAFDIQLPAQSILSLMTAVVAVDS